MTPAGLTTLVRIATARDHSEIRAEARQILRDTAYTFLAVALIPIILTFAIGWALVPA